ncbi:MAG: glycosyltransferase family 4 protein [Pseudomonadaceae bacterium]|nr:glycosyltransferase family 4 protein [Pseudomonadaceae bacterium]
MRVILSIEPVRFPLTGIGRYTYELARALQAHTAVTELKLFGTVNFADHLPSAQERAGRGFRLKEMLQKSPLASETYRRLVPLLKRRALRKHSDCIYHGPNFYLPPFSGCSVATFHDLSPFKWPQCAPAQRVRFMQKELELALQRADALITDSQYTKAEIGEYFSVPSERIFTAPLAAGAEFHPRAPHQTRNTLHRLGLEHGGYSLYVGTIEPRKNLLMLLEAYRQLPVKLRQRWPLILTGFRGWRSEEIHEEIAQAEREGWARYLGFTSVAELPELLAGARLFCFPSRYEGFGLPVLEAMSSGVPVVCSNSSSLPEVAGDTALMADPDDLQGLSECLRRGLEDERWRGSAKVSGRARSEMFSWARCADDTVNVYKHLTSHR